MAGPGDLLGGFDTTELSPLRRKVYAAAAGGTPDPWSKLDEIITAEGQTGRPGLARPHLPKTRGLVAARPTGAGGPDPTAFTGAPVTRTLLK